MRFIPLALLAFLALSFGAVSPAVAGDIPNFGAESLILEEDDLPDGWEMDVDSSEDDFPAGFPNDTLLEEAGGDDIDTSSLIVESRLLRSPSKALCYCAIIDADMDESFEKYRDAVKAKGAAGGWLVADVGDARRILVIAAPESDRAMLAEKQKEVGARNLGELAYARLLSDFHQGKPGPTSLKRAVEFADASETLVGSSPLSMTIKGIVHLFREEEEAGVKAIRDHVDGDGALLPSDTLRSFAYGLLARALMERKKDEANSEALQWITKSISLEKAALAQAREINDTYLFVRVWGNHMHRTSLLTRLGRKDDALEALGPMMELGKRLLTMGSGWQQYFEHVWFWTEEYDSLRSDKRFKEALEPHAPKDYKWDERLEELKKAKKRRDEAERQKGEGRQKVTGGKKKDSEKEDGATKDEEEKDDEEKDDAEGGDDE